MNLDGAWPYFEISLEKYICAVVVVSEMRIMIIIVEIFLVENFTLTLKETKSLTLHFCSWEQIYVIAFLVVVGAKTVVDVASVYHLWALDFGDQST